MPHLCILLRMTVTTRLILHMPSTLSSNSDMCGPGLASFDCERSHSLECLLILMVDREVKDSIKPSYYNFLWLGFEATALQQCVEESLNALAEL